MVSQSSALEYSSSSPLPAFFLPTRLFALWAVGYPSFRVLIPLRCIVDRALRWTFLLRMAWILTKYFVMVRILVCCGCLASRIPLLLNLQLSVSISMHAYDLRANLLLLALAYSYSIFPWKGISYLDPIQAKALIDAARQRGDDLAHAAEDVPIKGNEEFIANIKYV